MFIRQLSGKQVESNAGDGGSAYSDATLVRVIECAVKLIHATRHARPD